MSWCGYGKAVRFDNYIALSKQKKLSDISIGSVELVWPIRKAPPTSNDAPIPQQLQQFHAIFANNPPWIATVPCGSLTVVIIDLFANCYVLFYFSTN
jgi:hypothetical protein